MVVHACAILFRAEVGNNLPELGEPTGPTGGEGGRARKDRHFAALNAWLLVQTFRMWMVG